MPTQGLAAERDLQLYRNSLRFPRPLEREFLADFGVRQTFAGQQLALRLGINSGPVVAAVIGFQRFSYDVWGDTVNVASRMESQGRSGVIQVTCATYHLINHKFHCEPGGSIDVKGKGRMDVWHVLDPL